MLSDNPIADYLLFFLGAALGLSRSCYKISAATPHECKSLLVLLPFDDHFIFPFVVGVFHTLPVDSRRHNSDYCDSMNFMIGSRSATARFPHFPIYTLSSCLCAISRVIVDVSPPLSYRRFSVSAIVTNLQTLRVLSNFPQTAKVSSSYPLYSFPWLPNSNSQLPLRMILMQFTVIK